MRLGLVVAIVLGAACAGTPELEVTIEVEGSPRLAPGSVLELGVLDTDGSALSTATQPIVELAGEAILVAVTLPPEEQRGEAPLLIHGELRDEQGRPLFRTAMPAIVGEASTRVRLELVELAAARIETDLFVCDDTEVRARFPPGRVELDLGRTDGRAAERLVLPLVLSASGARYADGSSMFWQKGPQARLGHAGRTLDCVQSGAVG